MNSGGRCYCGHVTIAIAAPPQTVAYCHCADCRRWTGAPAPAFAAFADTDVSISPDVAEHSHSPGVARRNCPSCGSPLTARFDYLPGQTYAPVGILNNAAELPPVIHCHTASKLPWIVLHDDLPQEESSARKHLKARSS